ncbi:MAG TPA: winged helix-turn-helix domain-containing protein [Terracidiphilus sp.]|nr:winged helix-turn-helix domain-containing protein [Terracidiphilus sp.]
MLELPQNGASPSNGFHKVRFGEFEADLGSGEIRKAGSRIKLQDQPFKVLQVLLENPGDIVSREELQSRIWPDDTYGDFDHAVNVAVGKLRTALGDSADNPVFIETVPRRGYRFVGAVEAPPVVVPPAELPIAAGAAGGVGSSGVPKWRGLLLVLLALIACAGLVAGGVLLGRRSVRTQPAEIERLTINHGTIHSARFAPDGRNVFYAASWEGDSVQVFSTDLKFPGSRTLGLTASDLLAVSSAGEMAVLQPAQPEFMTGMIGTLGQVPLTGGTPRQVAEKVEWADWSPDGKSLAVVRNAGGRVRLEYPLGHVLYETSGWISHVRVSPNGSQIAFLDHPTYSDDEGGVSVVDLQGRKTVLSDGWESEEGLAWSPKGNEVWFSATHAGLQRQIYAVDMAGHQRLAFRALGGVTLQDIAPDGRVLMTRDEQRAGIRGRARGETKERDLSWQDWSLLVDISRDGKTLLFDEQGEQTGPNYAVAMRDLTGSPPVALGEGMAGDFSPDGKWVAASVSYTQLVLLPTGVGSARRIDRGNIERYGHEIHWLPDGKALLFGGDEPGHAARCFVQSIDGGKPRPVTPEGVGFCRISPDGKLIAANGTKATPMQFYPMDGSAPRPIPGLQPGESVAWTSDPNVLYVAQHEKASIRVFRLDLRTGQRKLFQEISVPDGPGICDMTHVLFSPDGRAYAYGYTRLLSDLYMVAGLK